MAETEISVRAATELEARDAAVDDGENADPDAVAEADNTVPSVIKMKLSAACDNKRLRSKLNTIVEDMNRVMAEAYLFGNFHIRRILNDASTAVPTIDRNFYYRCILAVSTTNSRPSTLGPCFAKSVELFDALRPVGSNKVDARDYNQIVADLSILMATMATNHLLMNVSRRVKNYLQWKHPSLRKQHNNIVKAVVHQPNLPLSKVFTSQKASTTVGQAADVVNELRAWLRNDKKVQFASKAHTLLPLYLHLLTQLEVAKSMHDAAQASEGVVGKRKSFKGRFFTLLPMKAGFTVSHVPISSMMLLKILKTLGLEKNIKGDGRHEDPGVYWRRYFNINLVETRNRKFSNRVVTDGFAVGLLMSTRSRIVNPGADAQTPLEDARKAYLDDLLRSDSLNGLRVVSVDPGFRDVVTISDKNGGVRSFSSGRYYHESKVFKSLRYTNRSNAETTSLTDWDSNTKSVTEASFVKSYLAALPTLIRHRMDKAYRFLRFLRYVHKQKTVHSIVEMIAPSEPGVKTLVFFGDWKGGSSSPVSRRTSGPIVLIKKELLRRDDVLFRSVDEYNTSKKDHNTWEDMVHMRAETTTRKRNEDGTRKKTFGKVFSVLHCKNSAVWPLVAWRETTWNRDVNASKNILMLGLFELLDYARPPAFSRPSVRAPRANG